MGMLLKFLGIALYILIALLAPLLLFIVVMKGQTAPEKQCFEANEVWNTSSFMVTANPKSSDLLRSQPLGNQVSRWMDTGYYVMASGSDENGFTVSTNLSGKITGKWYPFEADGEARNKRCQMTECIDAPTIHGCQRVNPELTPCYLDQGAGLYGLIIMDGLKFDPNSSPEHSEQPPFSRTRSFHFGPFTDGNGNFNITHVFACEQNDTGYTCKPTASNMSGRLYLKIQDSYYGDNSGGYEVRFASGTYQKGIIYTTITAFENQLKEMSNFLNNSKNSFYQQLKTIGQVVLFLYISLRSLAFLLGMMRSPTLEIVMDAVKIALIITMLNQNGYQFFDQNFFQIFRTTAETVSNAIVNVSLQQKELVPGFTKSGSEAPQVLPGIAGVHLIKMDTILNGCISEAIRAKVAAIMFTTNYFYVAFIIMFAILCIIFSLLHAVLNYLFVSFRFTILVIVFPIFMLLSIFKFFNTFIHDWIKQMMIAAVLMILTTLAVTMLTQIITLQLVGLLKYKVCSSPADLLLWKNVYVWWYPESSAEVEQAIDLSKALYLLVMSFLFYRVITTIPRVADALIGAFVGANQVIQSTINGRIPELLKSQYLPTRLFGSVLNRIPGLNGAKLYEVVGGVPIALDKAGDILNQGIASIDNVGGAREEQSGWGRSQSWQARDNERARLRQVWEETRRRNQ